MKKILFSAACLFVLSASSQNEWNSTNNSTSPMARTGNVGIGTAVLPAIPLVVNPSSSGAKAAFGAGNLLTGGLGTTGSAIDIISSSSSILGTFAGPSGNENYVQLVSTATFGYGIAAGARGGAAAPDFWFSNNGNQVTLKADGRFVIGNAVTSTPGTYKLYVQDGILTEKVKVAVNGTVNWSDHVFASNYHLKPIEEVAEFIRANHHLPGIPSAEEVVKNGVDVGEMDARLLEKIEEMMLYIIDLKKEVELLKQENSNLKSNKK